MERIRLICIFYEIKNKGTFCDVYTKAILSGMMLDIIVQNYGDNFDHNEKKKSHIVLGQCNIEKNQIKVTSKLMRSKAIKYERTRKDLMSVDNFIINKKTLDMIKYLIDKPNLILSDGTLIRYDQFDEDDQMSVPSSTEIIKSYGYYDRKINKLIKMNWYKDGEFTVYGKYVIMNKRFADADGDDLEKWDRIKIDREELQRNMILVNKDPRWHIINEIFLDKYIEKEKD
jgi:hypothetical protein